MDHSHSPEASVSTYDQGYSYSDFQTFRPAASRRRDPLPAELFRYKVVKRSLDLTLTFLLFPLLLPLLLIVAALVFVSSPGPIFYSHRRIRRNGAFFSMWKFRTMRVNSAEVLDRYLDQHPRARAEWKRTHKLKHDPRVTRIGRFLRCYSLDELPQIWNVFRGQMSLVGPRPIVAAEVEKYADQFDCYCRVKPGITGLWQVSGRSKLTYSQRVLLDCKYVAQWSLAGDIAILARTFASVANQDGAF